MPEFDFDLFVIGGGSGGVRAARIAASHGARVAIAEDYRLGGTCVIRGCVPKKLLVYGASFAEDLKDAKRFGWDVPDCRFDWPHLRDEVQAEVARLEDLYRDTLATRGVRIFQQRAGLLDPHTVELADGSRHGAKIILVATGARPVLPTFPGADLGVSSNEVFHFKAVPKRMVIAGGGYIANEFAGIFNSFGSKVTMVLRGGEILRRYDAAVRDRLMEISRSKGIDFRFDTKFEGVDQEPDGTLAIRTTDGRTLKADCLLFALGRRPNSAGLGLEKLGVALAKSGAIVVDADSRTNVPSIFAVGDVTDRVQLTPVAIREGHAFADTQFGNLPHRVDYDCIPSAVYSHPPIAAVGLTEAEAREKHGMVNVYTADFRPMKNVLAQRDERALYKMVTDGVTGQVLGLHMIGPDAPEILQAAAVAVKAKLTKAQFDETVALHPTMSEELVLMR
jgi:glutathione reductase (NADPH)